MPTSNVAATRPGLLVSSTPATAGTARLADPMVGAPAVDDCYALTYKQGFKHAISEKTVDCGRTHTMRVVAVGQLPTSVDWEDSKAVHKVVTKTCDPAWQKITGKQPTVTYRTLWSSWWFAPTEAQIDDGARWFSCEVALNLGERLIPLPKGKLPKATKNPADSIARCATKRYTTVPCSKPHAWRTVFTFTTKGQGKGDRLTQSLRRAAIRRCGPAVPGDNFLWSARHLESRTYVIACLQETKR